MLGVHFPTLISFLSAVLCFRELSQQMNGKQSVRTLFAVLSSSSGCFAPFFSPVPFPPTPSSLYPPPAPPSSEVNLALIGCSFLRQEGNITRAMPRVSIIPRLMLIIVLLLLFLYIFLLVFVIIWLTGLYIVFAFRKDPDGLSERHDY